MCDIRTHLYIKSLDQVFIISQYPTETWAEAALIEVLIKDDLFISFDWQNSPIESHYRLKHTHSPPDKLSNP